MSPSANPEWVSLREFDDPILARDVVTAILSMEFDAILVDLSHNTIVAGASDFDPASDESLAKPLELKSNLAGYDPVLGIALPVNDAAKETEPEIFQWDSESKGPWQLMVPRELHEELDSILHVIIEEQKKFDSDHMETQRTKLLIGRFIVILILIFVVILALRFIGVL